MKEFYETNEDFKAYVDRYCTKHQIDVDTALTHALVKDAAAYYGYKE